jgi:hypothetical protein
MKMSLEDRMQNLPVELQNHIQEYNPEHRLIHGELLYKTLLELDDIVNYSYCENEMCEKYANGYCNGNMFWLLDENAVEATILNQTYNYCCESCASYDTWSKQYDFRKAYRGSPDFFANILRRRAERKQPSTQFRNFKSYIIRSRSGIGNVRDYDEYPF